MGVTDSVKKMFDKPKSLDELEEEEEEYDLKLSIAQKRAAIRELEKRGQNPNHFKFGGKFDFMKIFRWLREH
jgi:hypothetical protein